jgi:uncharacterized DUF497 family protein
MRIIFDPIKRDATLRDRRVDFADAVVVFEGPVFTFPTSASSIRKSATSRWACWLGEW